MAARWVNTRTIESITEEQLEHWVQKRCKKDESGEDLHLNTDALGKVSVYMHMWEAEDGARWLHRTYQIAIQNAGYGNLLQEKCHTAFKHVFQKLNPNQLKVRMRNRIRWRETKHFDKTAFTQSWDM